MISSVGICLRLIIKETLVKESSFFQIKFFQVAMLRFSQNHHQTTVFCQLVNLIGKMKGLTNLNPLLNGNWQKAMSQNVKVQNVNQTLRNQIVDQEWRNSMNTSTKQTWNWVASWLIYIELVPNVFQWGHRIRWVKALHIMWLVYYEQNQVEVKGPCQCLVVTKLQDGIYLEFKELC